MNERMWIAPLGTPSPKDGRPECDPRWIELLGGSIESLPWRVETFLQGLYGPTVFTLVLWGKPYDAHQAHGRPGYVLTPR